MKKILTFEEYKLIEAIIKSNDPLDSFRKGFLSFLDVTEKSIKSTIANSERFTISTDEISISVDMNENLLLFIVENLKKDKVSLLLDKLSTSKVKSE